MAFTYLLHGLKIEIELEVTSWIAARQSPEYQDADLAAVRFEPCERTRIPVPGPSKMLVRRGSVSVARGAHGLVLTSEANDIAWLPNLPATPADCERRGCKVFFAPAPDEPRELFERTLSNNWLPNVLSANGHIMLHAACIRIGGHLILICGDSGAGKSTLAAGFGAQGLEVYADDVTRVEHKSKFGYLGFQSYPGIHLRQSSFFGTKHVDPSQPKGAKRWLEISNFKRDAPALPIAAMYFISRQRSPHPTIQPFTFAIGLQHWIKTLFMDAAPREQRATQALTRAAGLSASIPAFHLRYRRSEKHFDKLIGEIIRHTESLTAQVAA